MASISSTPVHIIDDDDDEFDWEAAVREIDNASCQTAYTNSIKPSIFVNNNDNNYSSNYSNPVKKEIQKKFTSGKQSTLDKFIGIGSNSGVQKAWPGNLSNGGAFREGDNSGGNFNNLDCNNDDFYDNGEAGFAEESSSCVKIDPEAAKTWIYPVYAEKREYQYNITRTALFSNTLVVLPTGLGKTLIAAVVMYNYFRWFPEGKIVFAAPSRPLVMQQIEACHNIVGIPQEWTIDLTGQTSPTKRAVLWKEKRVFFVTPQVLEKDISSGSCLVSHLVCLVIDEAHRATGKYAYCEAVHQLMAVPVQFRILALSATPGSKQQTIQLIIDNLHISTLEYRNESDSDVARYVHGRKIELIQVAMGKDAVQINDLLSAVMRAYVARLSAVDLLQDRDFQTLSPCELLNSREKFRQAPPPNLPHMKYGEVEGCFGVLITLYHVRKLLSIHGIKPAFEMLEEKLHQGSFARLMNRNEVLLRAKLLMQQHVTHGAPSPKLSKLLEVLLDHFKKNDSQKSRVIIFSNFRGSVRDIMNALASAGDHVKATEFIGQSSGKSLKGQSQKVQQAVLEKFRSGKFNVIVATSIGEEGLDIMEVDLVICFDANVSPLRMIQRMGRTGRKHEGRVVVLACEGSELKGYLRNQSKSKAIKKHMRNGGWRFNFHPSPRMIPHVYKPAVQFVELSIEQFVHRGKKMKDDQLMHSPTCILKLTDAETKLVAKYFSSVEEDAWKPSLIAFPLFQSYPSRVHNVMHSSRTGMLIDTMQYLQESSLSRGSKAFVCEDKLSSDPCHAVEAVGQCYLKGSQTFKELLPECEASVLNTNHVDSESNLECCGQYAKAHRFLFGSDVVSVDDVGMVQILTFPEILLSHQSKKDIGQSKGVFSTLERSSEEKSLPSGLCSPNGHLEAATGLNRIILTPSPKEKPNERNEIDEYPLVVEKRTSALLDEESNNDLGDVDISPRLTCLIKSGCVPESPINDGEISKSQEGSRLLDTDLVPTPRLQTNPVKTSLLYGEIRSSDICTFEKDIPAVSADEIGTPLLAGNINPPQACNSAISLHDEAKSPLAQLSNLSCSKDWHLSSGDQSKSVELQCKFKRLRKYGDHSKKFSLGQTVDSESCRNFHGGANHDRGAKKRGKKSSVFIEEEAEVSPEVLVSDDEEDLPDSDSYDDSFIDDRINPIGASTQVESGVVDMMAIYRRSLLSQSPMERVPIFSTTTTPDSVALRTRSSEGASTSGTETRSLQTPHAGPDSDKTSTDAMPKPDLSFPDRNDANVETRKRKLSFYQAGSLLAHNLEKEFLSASQSADRDLPPEKQVEETADCDVFDDDQIFEGIDLDAVEEQAAKLLQLKSENTTQRNGATSDALCPKLSVTESPTFDLGI